MSYKLYLHISFLDITDYLNFLFLWNFLCNNYLSLKMAYKCFRRSIQEFKGLINNGCLASVHAFFKVCVCIYTIQY